MKVGRPVIHTRAALLDHALRLSAEFGYNRVTRDQLASAAGMSTGQVSNLFGTMTQLRRAIMSAAVARNDLIVIAQGLINKEPKALALPDDLKLRALEQMI